MPAVRRPDPPWIVLVVAACVAGPAVVFAAMFGQQVVDREVWKPIPRFEPVDAAPAMRPPGVIAYVEQGHPSETAEGPVTGCVFVVPAAGGNPRQLGCAGDGTVPSALLGIAWTARGDLEIYGEPEANLPNPVVVPVGAGRTARNATPEAQRVRGSRRDGTTVMLGDRTEELDELDVIAPDGSVDVIVSMDGPQGYQFGEPQWSPDGRWILWSDTEGRLLLTDPKGGDVRAVLPASQGRRWIGEPFLTWHQGRGGR